MIKNTISNQNRMPLHHDESDFHWVFQRLLSFEDKPAVIWNDIHWSYRELSDAVVRWLNVLHENNVVKNRVVAICGGYTLDACALFIALLINKNIIVPVGQVNETHREKLVRLTSANVIFEFFENNTHYNLILNGSHSQHAYYSQLNSEHAAGLILFSSGSTGEHKGIVLNLDKLLERVKQLKNSYRTLAFMTFDHVGGINTLLHTLLQGGALISLPNRSAEAVCKAIEKYQIELLPTTPTFLKILLMSNMTNQYNLSSIKLITYGSEPMPSTVLDVLYERFPKVKLKQTYGLSELGILPTKSETGNSLWFRLGENIKYKVVNGLLYINTNTAMLGYLNADNLLFDQEGWFFTGDSVKTKQINGEEYLMVLGRKSEIINVGGEKVYPAEIENFLLKMTNISDVTVIGKPNPVTGQIVVAKVKLLNPEDQKSLYKRMRKFCENKLESYKIPFVIEIVEGSMHNDRFKKIRK